LTVIVSPNTTTYPTLTTDGFNPQSTEVSELPPREDMSSMAQDSVNTTRSAIPTGSETLPLAADRLPSEMITPLMPATNRPAGMSLAENALREADDALTTINLSDTWEGALEKIKWVMDTLGPVAEVRIHDLVANPLLSRLSSLAEPVCKDGTWSTSRDPQGDPFALLSC
jgi:hypothetical protein